MKGSRSEPHTPPAPRHEEHPPHRGGIFAPTFSADAKKLVVPKVAERDGGRARNRMAPSASRAVPSLLAGAGLNRLAGPPSLPCWWESRQAQPVCPPRRPVPSGPAQTARGAGRGLPACFSFRAGPGCSPDIPEGTCRRQSRPWLGKRGCRRPRGQSATVFSLPCRHFRSCLIPPGIWATLLGP